MAQVQFFPDLQKIRGEHNLVSYKFLASQQI